MKKIISSSILLLFFFFFFLPVYGYAKTSDIPISESLFGENDIPGVTCGDGLNEEINKCCVIKINSTIEVKDPGFFCLPLGGPCASELAKKAFDSFFKNSSTLIQVDQLLLLAEDSGGCIVGEPTNLGSTDCKCKASPLTSFCDRYAASGEKTSCNKCVENGNAFWTGLGCINLTPVGFVKSVARLGLGIAGATSLLCIIYSAFILQASRGNPEKIKKAKEYLSNCIMGLLIIILSVFILRIIGVEILRIPLLQ